MKRQRQMQKAFGVNEFGLVDFPVKISNVRISRIIMVMKEVAPGASLMDGKQITQPCLSTGSETGNASEKPNGNPVEEKAGLLPAFFLISQLNSKLSDAC